MPRSAFLLGGLALALSAQSPLDDAAAAFRAGRYSEARQALAKADPANRLTRILLAMTDAATGRCESAIQTLSEAAAREPAPVGPMAGVSAVKCSMARNDEQLALSLLHTLTARFPSDADVLYVKAKWAMQSFDETTRAMFQRTPASYRVHQLSAEIFETQNRWSEAVNEYRKALAQHPAAPDLHFRLGRALLMQEHGPEALAAAEKEFEAERRVNPEDAPTEFQLGQVSLAQGDLDRAQQHLERALTLAPDYVAALVALGQCQAKKKQLAAAIPLLERAIRLQPQSEPAHYALMLAYRDIGNLEAARREQQKLDELRQPPGGEFADFLKRLGEQPSSLAPR